MEFVTHSSYETKKLGNLLAEEVRGGEIICLTGDLGAGKTTFTQGLLRGLGIKGAITSPTFAIIKDYQIKERDSRFMKKNSKKNTSQDLRSTVQHVYHIDAYRVEAKDLESLGWKDFAGKPDSIVVIEWAERIKKIIPTNAVWIKFKWLGDKERKLSLK